MERNYEKLKCSEKDVRELGKVGTTGTNDSDLIPDLSNHKQ